MQLPSIVPERSKNPLLDLDVKLGLKINKALVEKNGTNLISSIASYMHEFKMTADEETIMRIPKKYGA